MRLLKRVSTLGILAAFVGVAMLMVPTMPASAEDRVTICHVPPGNPNNRHTITVSASAVPAHLAHGDSLGPCAV